MNNENLNTGKVVDFKEIKDYQKAAKDFAEGNGDLEKLLLNCFAKKIETLACCAGHIDKKWAPYISFVFSPENEQLIYALLSKLKDTGFNFRYTKNHKGDGKSFFTIQNFDFSKPLTLFNRLVRKLKMSYNVNS